MKRTLAVLLAVLLTLSVIAGCSVQPKGGTDAPGGGTSGAPGGGTSDGAKEADGCGEIDIGSFAADGYELNIAAGTFEKGAEINVTAVGASELSKFEDADRYEIIGSPVGISSESYRGGLFGTDVELTLPIPGDELESYVVLYWDDDIGEVRYMTPTSFDTAAGTMTVMLPHFCYHASGKLTENEVIERFLDSYASKEAVARAEDAKAASELEPYIKAKVAALNLTEDAARELTVSVINAVGAQFGEDAGVYTDIVTTACKSLDKKDASDFEAKMEEIISGKCYDMLNYNLVNGRAEFPFKDVGKAATIIGALEGGDMKTAMRELGDAIGSAVPEIGLATKAVGYVGAKVNECFTNWKSNQIEELYQIYRNGARDFWGNEVIAGDEESLKTYIHTASGFTLAKGVYRFYNMDKVAETCEKYGWGRKEYDELDEKYRDEFDRRAEEGLMNYFRTRLSQEKEAERIKEDERACIEQMLKSYGALSAGLYGEFFGEQSRDDYDLNNRLERLVKVKRFISMYVDENKLAKSAKLGEDGYNYGNLLNEWVMSVTGENTKSEAIDRFIAFLREADLLNPAYAAALSMNELAGTYTGVSFKALRVSQQVFEAYVAEYGEEKITSRAQCDNAIAEQLAENDMSGFAESFFTLEADRGDPSAGKLSIVIHGEDGDYTASGRVKLDGEKLIVYNDEGSTEAAVAKNTDGAYTVKGECITLDLPQYDEGEMYLLFVDFTLDAVKN